MSNFVVTNIYLTKPQKKYLKKESDRLGLKSSELLRRILDKYMKEEEQENGMEQANNKRSKKKN